MITGECPLQQQLCFVLAYIVIKLFEGMKAIDRCRSSEVTFVFLNVWSLDFLLNIQDFAGMQTGIVINE